MQRVPVALKLGYKGPRRRFLRHICGQVQEWLKFLYFFFVSTKSVPVQTSFCIDSSY